MRRVPTGLVREMAPATRPGSAPVLRATSAATLRELPSSMRVGIMVLVSAAEPVRPWEPSFCEV